MSVIQKTLWDNIPEKTWKDFRAAREFVRNLGLSEIHHWGKYVSGEYQDFLPLPSDIPEDPDIHYRYSGWNDWEDWLGIAPDRVNPEISQMDLWSKNYRPKWKPFPKARNKAWDYGFEYKEEWEAFVAGRFYGREPLPDDIPVNPDVIYRHVGWKNWKDWLVPWERIKEYSSFTKAREFVRCLRLKGIIAWRNYILNESPQHPDYNLIIPEKPDLEYQDTGWRDWNDWLGIEIKFRDFHTTRNFVKSLKLKNRSQWMDYCNNQLPGKKPKPENIYSFPEIAYMNEGWKDWQYWLGSEQINDKQFLEESANEFKECRCRGRILNCPDCDGKGYLLNKDNPAWS